MEKKADLLQLRIQEYMSSQMEKCQGNVLRKQLLEKNNELLNALFFDDFSDTGQRYIQGYIRFLSLQPNVLYNESYFLKLLDAFNDRLKIARKKYQILNDFYKILLPYVQPQWLNVKLVVDEFYVLY